MNVMIHQQAEREAQRVQANQDELVERIARAIREDGTVQPLKGLHLSRSSLPFKPLHSVLKPSAQGSKEVLLGDSRYRYGPSQYLLATVELPRVSQVLEASKERPYLGLRLELAPTLVSSVMVEAWYSSPRDHAAIPEAAPAPGGPPSAAGRRPRRGKCGLSHGLPDASHFNREYKGLFGVPPIRDVQRLREGALVSAGR